MEVRIEKIQEVCNKDLEELNCKKAEMNNTKTEVKNTLEVKILKMRITEAEELISELEKRVIEITTGEQNKGKERIKTISQNLSNLWEIIKCNHICIIGCSRRRRMKERT